MKSERRYSWKRLDYAELPHGQLQIRRFRRQGIILSGGNGCAVREDHPACLDRRSRQLRAECLGLYDMGGNVQEC